MERCGVRRTESGGMAAERGRMTRDLSLILDPTGEPLAVDAGGEAIDLSEVGPR
jgi:hypothetical protein